LAIRELLGLLINPDRARFRLTLDDDLRAAPRYEHGRRALTAVLYKLQQDLLIAYENENPLPRIYWINKKPRDLLGALDFRIFAEAAVAVWPELRTAPARTMQSAAILAPREGLDPECGDDRLRPANDRRVHKAIADVYDNALGNGEKPPNINEIVDLVQVKLSTHGFFQSGRQIKILADAPEHKARRRKPGATLASEKRRNKA
jgi:hypothetical protein